MNSIWGWRTAPPAQTAATGEFPTIATDSVKKAVVESSPSEADPVEDREQSLVSIVQSLVSIVTEDPAEDARDEPAEAAAEEEAAAEPAAEEARDEPAEPAAEEEAAAEPNADVEKK